MAQIAQRNKWPCSVVGFTNLQKCPHGDKYWMFKHKYKFIHFKYKYEYKYFKTVLEYNSSTSRPTSTKCTTSLLFYVWFTNVVLYRILNLCTYAWPYSVVSQNRVFSRHSPKCLPIWMKFEGSVVAWNTMWVRRMDGFRPNQKGLHFCNT